VRRSRELKGNATESQKLSTYQGARAAKRVVLATLGSNAFRELLAPNSENGSCSNFIDRAHNLVMNQEHKSE
jgi:hypothetical protein